MTGQRLKKLIFLIGFSLLLVFTCLFYTSLEHTGDEALALIVPDALLQMEESHVTDIDMLRFHGEPAAVDVQHDRVYIPISDVNVPISGLSSLLPGCKLYILEDEAAASIEESIRLNRPLSLIAVRGSAYQRFELILSPFPVMRMDSRSSRLNWDERTMYAGSYSLFSPGEGSSVASGSAEWIDRGATSATLPKKPLRLMPKKLNGSDMKVDFLDLGQDDEWVLNALGFDDTKLREVFAMEFWNRYIADESNGCFNMSEGRWIELVLDGQYHGLYYLQRYIDDDYLPINKDTDLIFKGMHMLQGERLVDNYEVVWSPYSTEQSYAILSSALNFENASEISLPSFMDFQALVDLTSGSDNIKFKNCYYILRPNSEGGYTLYLLPWDTDMSFGLCYNGTLYYDYDRSLNNSLQRQEYETMLQQYPDLAQRYAAHWQQLRETCLKQECIFPIFTDIKATLDSSGALLRDYERWGYIHGDADTYEQLFVFTKERLALMDARLLSKNEE